MDLCTLKHRTLRTETGLLSYLRKGLPSPGRLPTASQNLGELEERGLGRGGGGACSAATYVGAAGASQKDLPRSMLSFSGATRP